MPDLVLEYHRLKTPIDHPLRSVTREHLEYPTENVTFAYLIAIGKTVTDYLNQSPDDEVQVYTSDIFTDRAIEGWNEDCSGVLAGRWNDVKNMYYEHIDAARSSRDFYIAKVVDGSMTVLGYEAVDLQSGVYYRHKFSISGSTLKGFRTDMTSPKITVTDTTFASGRFGHGGDAGSFTVYSATKLLPPESALPGAVAIMEVEYEGSGTEHDPIRPVLKHELVDILRFDGLPNYLYIEAKKYHMLKSRGFTDEEIMLLLGYVPQHQIDLASITWGAFEFITKQPTVVIMVLGDNPYRRGAIEKQIEFARSRNLRVMKPPRDYKEAVMQYQQLRADYIHWLAGKDNFAYQVLGHEELELFAVADFYFGELVEHRTHYHQIKRVPDWEMWRTIERWFKRLEKVTILTEERDKHLNKLRRVMKLGW